MAELELADLVRVEGLEGLEGRECEGGETWISRFARTQGLHKQLVWVRYL